MLCVGLVVALFAMRPAAAHLAAWHPSMFGFNWSLTHDYSAGYDNRPVAPLIERPFSEWWMHGPDHIAMPPNPGDFLELPAGGKFEVQMACDKSATDYWETSGNADFRQGDWPCPGSGPDQFHTRNINDTMGCAFAIAYKSDINAVQPTDFTIFTVNYTCPWYRAQYFDVPADLPPCDDCICMFNWFHSPDDGAQQMYQNGYKCKVLNDGPSKQLQTPQVARRCGPDPYLNRPANASNCTGGVNGGAKQPMYWLQAEGNNMFEDYYHPPLYNALYGFMDGAQTDIFVSGDTAPTSSSTSVVTASTSTSASVTSAGSATTTPTAAAGVQASVEVSIGVGLAATPEAVTSPTSTSSATASSSTSTTASASTSISTSASPSASVASSSSSSSPSSSPAPTSAPVPTPLTASTADTCAAQAARKRALQAEKKARRKAKKDRKRKRRKAAKLAGLAEEARRGAVVEGRRRHRTKRRVGGML